jgi:hypothetical protein
MRTFGRMADQMDGWADSRRRLRCVTTSRRSTRLLVPRLVPRPRKCAETFGATDRRSPARPPVPVERASTRHGPPRRKIVAAPVAAHRTGFRSTTGLSARWAPVYGTEGQRFESSRARFSFLLRAQAMSCEIVPFPRPSAFSVVQHRDPGLRKPKIKRGVVTRVVDLLVAS